MFRLLPSAVICATITAAICLVATPLPLFQIAKQYAKSILFYPLGPWIDGVYWTLGIEVSFYSLVFLLLCLRRKNLIEPVMIGIGLVSMALWIGSGAAAPALLPTRYMQLLLLHHGMHFALGVVLCASYTNGLTKWRAAFCAVFLAGGVLPIAFQARETIGIPSLVPQTVWVASVLLMMLAVTFDARISEFLSDRAKRNIARMGVATYPLYLLHDIAGAWIMTLMAWAGRYVALLSSMVVITIAALAIGAFLDTQPVRTFIKAAIARAIRIVPLKQDLPEQQTPL
ncbi:hypothetical protein NKI97_07615 [Mesorhizobium sp. M0296]